jgi:hypothetical protein
MRLACSRAGMQHAPSQKLFFPRLHTGLAQRGTRTWRVTRNGALWKAV